MISKLKLFFAKNVRVFIFLTAVTVRIYLIITHGTIVNDGIVYIDWAKKMAEGNFIGGTALNIFNLYPLLILISYKVLNFFGNVSYEMSAMILNSLFGIAVIFPLYKITEKYFGFLPAMLTGFYIALQPEFLRMSCDVLRGPAYLCGVIFAFYFLITALKFPSPKAWSLWKIALAGMLILFSALVRLEALVLFGCFAITILLARAERGRPYLFAERLKRLLALGSTIIILAVPAAGIVRVKTGEWHLARLDKITAPWSMGKIKTHSKDPLKDLTNKLQSQMYSKNGTENPDIGTCVRFIKMAKTHRWIIYGSEILAALWKALHGVAAIAFVFGVIYVIRKKLLPLDDPLSVTIIAATVLFGVMFLLYVEGGKFYLATRHIIIMSLFYSVFVGVPALAAIGKSLPVKLFALAVILTAFGIIIYKDSHPIRTKKLPMKYCGLRVAKQLPKNSVLLLPSSLRTIAYYADLPFKPLSTLETQWVKKFLNKKPDRYLIINKTKNWQIEFLNQITGAVKKIQFDSPASKRYLFEIYTGKKF